MIRLAQYLYYSYSDRNFSGEPWNEIKIVTSNLALNQKAINKKILNMIEKKALDDNQEALSVFLKQLWTDSRILGVITNDE